MILCPNFTCSWFCKHRMAQCVQSVSKIWTNTESGRHNATSGLYSLCKQRALSTNSPISTQTYCKFDSRQQTCIAMHILRHTHTESGEGLQGCWVKGSGIRLCCCKGHVGAQLTPTHPLPRTHAHVHWADTDNHAAHLLWWYAIRK